VLGRQGHGNTGSGIIEFVGFWDVTVEFSVVVRAELAVRGRAEGVEPVARLGVVR
jgi:hypothetical protein